jgi:hypothetical protein
MSHFVVVVVGEDVDQQLAPYHEFECTGHNDEFIQEIDDTDEYRAKFAESKVRAVQDENGTVFKYEDDQFWKDATEVEALAIDDYLKSRWADRDKPKPDFEWRTNNDNGANKMQVFKLPFGHSLIEVSESTVRTLREVIADDTGREEVSDVEAINIEGDHQYGYTLLDENGEVVKTVRRTNPNAHWDWYVVGGRWTGFFKLKENEIGLVGRPGVMGQPAEPGHADSCRKGAIDFNSMRNASAEEALKNHAVVLAAIGDATDFKTWVEIRQENEGNIDKAREIYHAQEAIKRLSAAKLHWLFNDALEFARKSKEQVEKEARQNTGVPYAVVKDGKWYAKGEMGWFGMSDDNMTDEQWAEQYAKMIDELPEDTLLTAVDCHI